MKMPLQTPPIIGKTRRPFAERFWSKVQRGAPDACWTWMRGKNQWGYGQFGINNAPYKAHRIAYWLTTGEWPTLCVLHKCDNPACCNPAHLFLGTFRENNDDKMSKGRQGACRGVRHYKARLTPNLVREMRSLHRKFGMGGRKLAARFGVAMGTVHGVISEKTWKHVTD